MLCAQPYTQNQIEKREIRIREALASAGLMVESGQDDFATPIRSPLGLTITLRSPHG